MKKIFVSLVALISLNAFSASGTLQFSGTASTTCSFGSQTNGTFAVDPSQPNVIGTSASGGSPATLQIIYFGTPTVTIEEFALFTTKPNGVANGDFTYTTLVSSTAGKQYTTVGPNKEATYSNGSSDTLSIQFNASKSSGNIALGNYAATSAVTCQ